MGFRSLAIRYLRLRAVISRESIVGQALCLPRDFGSRKACPAISSFQPGGRLLPTARKKFANDAGSWLCTRAFSSPADPGRSLPLARLQFAFFVLPAVR